MIERHTIVDRAQWLAWRSVDLTASDVGAAAGVSPYKTALALYAEKCGWLMPEAENAIMRRGRWFEAAALVALAEEHPDWAIEKSNMYLRDTELRLGATPDALAVTDLGGITNVQIKTINKMTFAAHWADGPPLDYLLQTVTEGMLLEADRSMLVALVVDNYSAELVEFDVPRHEAAEAKVAEIAKTFWQNIATGKRPVAQPARDAETVKALFPVETPGKVIDMSGDNLLPELLAEREALKATAKNTEDRLDEVNTTIKDKLGDAEKAVLPGWDLTLKTRNRNGYTVAPTKFRMLYAKRKNQEDAA